MDTKLDKVLDTGLMQFKIGELSAMTGVSTRQLRYWEQQGYIESRERTDGQSARVFGALMYFKTVEIKRFLDEGFKLSKANEKSEAVIAKIKTAHRFSKAMLKHLNISDNQNEVFLGNLNDDENQPLYAILNDGEVHYEVRG